MFDEEKEIDNSGVSRDIEGYTDIIGKQIYYINQLLTVGNVRIIQVENAINVFEALLSPYIELDIYSVELERFEQELAFKLRFSRSDDDYGKKNNLIYRFLTKKYSILLRYAKEKGFLPKTLKWDY